MNGYDDDDDNNDDDSNNKVTSSEPWSCLFSPPPRVPAGGAIASTRFEAKYYTRNHKNKSTGRCH